MAIRIEHTIDNQTQAPEGAKKLFIKSYGCQMNVYDAVRMGELMKPHGYVMTETLAEADLVVLNTCHIREKADNKMFSDIGRMRDATGGKALIAVGGCIGQAMGEDIMKRAPEVRVVFGPQTLHRLPEFINKAGLSGKGRAVDTEFPELEKFDALPLPGAYGPTSFVTIQEGCDKFCTYCVVPYTRGHEISRPAEHVLNEVRHLAGLGVKEVCLLGQNVNAYEDGEIDFVDLINKTADVEGIERIRFTTSHPNNMTDRLIGLFAEQEKLMPYLHLPVQAGSNKVLKDMNRNHTAEDYLAVIEKLRAVRPDIAISGDFIVGFPGETEDDFEKTLMIAAATDYASAYSFKYSPRPGTPAAAMTDQIPDEVSSERLAGLQALLNDQQEAFNATFVGKEIDVLVEEKTHIEGQLRGRSPHNIAVNFDGNERLIGHTIRVKINASKPKSIIGEIVLNDMQQSA